MDQSVPLVCLCLLVSFVVMLVLGEYALALITLLMLFATTKLTGN